MRFFLPAALLLGLLTGACATSPDSDDGVRRDRYVITFEELRELPSVSAYEAVQRLRPAWLQSRGPVSAGGASRSYPQVMMDGVTLGDINTLKDVRTEVIQELRFTPSRDATTRMGTGYMAGLIEIISRR